MNRFDCFLKTGYNMTNLELNTSLVACFCEVMNYAQRSIEEIVQRKA